MKCEGRRETVIWINHEGLQIGVDESEMQSDRVERECVEKMEE